MPTTDQAMMQCLPETLRTFISEGCRVRGDTFCFLPTTAFPEPAKSLLVHAHDMTSTLSTFHESVLRVDILQQLRLDDLYLREVFLRTVGTETIVEYGVIAIALDQFTPTQQQAIQAGQIPLGGLLHCFEIPFVSAPIGFFSIATECLAAKSLDGRTPSTCYGRFNRLAKPSGEPLAWILEILPPA